MPAERFRASLLRGMREAASIVRLESPTVEEFEESSSRGRIPLVIAGAMRGWGALSRWSLSYFEENLGDDPVTVLTVPEGGRDGYFGAGVATGFTHARIPFSEYRESLAVAGLPRYYLTGAWFPFLSGDIGIPVYLGDPSRLSPHLWLGGAGTVAPLHYDSRDNLHALVRGGKRFVLYDRKDFSRLYPHPMFSGNPHMSRVDLAEPDYRRFPRFRQARSIEAVLEPGEMLFIPAGWWHEVTSLETSFAVNFFGAKSYFSREAIHAQTYKRLIRLRTKLLSRWAR